MNMVTERADRLSTLDGLRGVAAFAILYLHYPLPDGYAQLLPAAYLAVDLFFVLSGFVVAKAYEDRLKSGMSVARFATVRTIRLYPLYIAGIALAAVLALLSLIAKGELSTGAGNYLATLGFSIAFLPTPQILSTNPYWLFPLNFVAWSLLWELVTNFAYGMFARQIGRWLLSVIIAVGALATIALVHGFGSAEIGPTPDTFIGGAARAVFGFFAGVALFRIDRRIKLSRLPFWALAGLLLIALARPLPLAEWLHDLLAILLVFPALVALGAHSRGSEFEQRVSHWLGYLSYPVYALQIPLFAILASGLRWTIDWPVETAPMPRMAVFFAFVIGLSWIAARYFDDPVRRVLSRRFISPAN